MKCKDDYCYPVFETNQILTSTQLNKVRSFLDDQNRTTRTDLTGTGIICGLEYEKSGNNIIIYSGYGISSEGYLISLSNKTAFNKYKSFSLKEIDKYEPWAKKAKNDQYYMADIKELVPANLTDDNTEKLENLNDLSKWVVVAFLHFDDTRYQTCTGNDCDNKGIKRKIIVKFLLVKKEDLSEVDIDKALTLKNQISELRINRLNCKAPISLQNVDTNKKLHNEYLNAITGINKTLSKEIRNAYKIYGRKLAMDYDIADELKNLETNFVKVQPIQYVYDFHYELTLALKEFSDCAYELLCTYSDPGDDFPRHLMLGEVKMDKNETKIKYRNYLRKAPVFTKQDKKYIMARMLFAKILAMINAFVLSLKRAPIGIDQKITPSKYFPDKLTDFTIPFHYKIDKGNNLLQNWNPELTLKHCQYNNLSYHFNDVAANNLVPNYVRNPLDFNINDYPFYRIEGHCGKNIDQALNRITQLKKKYNLDFKVTTLKLKPHEQNKRIAMTKYYFEHCDFEDLQNIYLQVRTEIFCMLKMIQKEFSGGFLKKYCMHLLPYGFDNIEEQLSKALTSSKHDFSDLIDFSVNKKLQLTGFEILPASLADFDFDIAVKHYKKIIDFFIRFKVLINYLEPVTLKYAYGKFCLDLMLVKKTINHFNHVFDQVINNCSIYKLAYIHFTAIWRVDHLFKNDLSIFKNYIARFSGLEHIAGVLRGGTFFLIYESDKDKKVVADFSLSSYCCTSLCEFPTAKLNLVPVAKPIYVELVKKKCGGEAIGEFEILKDEFEPEILKTFSIKLPKTSDLGAKLEYDEDKFIVKYKGDKDILFDSFNYTLISNTYKYRDTAKVTIYIKDNRNGILHANDDVAATTKDKGIAIDVLGNDIYTENVSILLLPDDFGPGEPPKPATKITTNLGAKVEVISRKKKPFLEYIPGIEGFDKFKYILSDPCALNKSEANVSVTVFCCDKQKECTLKDITKVADPIEWILLDFSKAGVKEGTIKFEYNDKIINIRETNNPFVFQIFPTGNFWENGDYTFGYSAYDLMATKECFANIILIPKFLGYFTPVRNINVGREDLFTIVNSAKYKTVINSNEALKKNVGKITSYYSTLESEMNSKPASFISGLSNTQVVDNTKKIVDPLIADIKSIDKKISALGAKPELKRRKEINLELLSNVTNAFLNTISVNKKDLAANSKAAIYLKNDLGIKIKSLGTSNIKTITGKINVASNPDKTRLNNIISELGK